jgi:kumamolisin
MAVIPAGHRQIAGTERRPVAGARRTGPAEPSEVVSVTVRLRRRADAPALPDPAEVLRQPIAERRYLSRDGFAEHYGADPADVARIETFAREYGLTVGPVNAAARMVALSGTVAQLSRAFAVKLRSYESAEVRYRGREGHVHLPADLADAVEGVFGLDNRPQARPLNRPVQGLAPAVTPLTPPQVAGLYVFPAGSAGGQCIGLLEFGGGYQPGDINAFFSDLGMPAPVISVVGVDGAVNSPGVNPMTTPRWCSASTWPDRSRPARPWRCTSRRGQSKDGSTHSRQRFTTTRTGHRCCRSAGDGRKARPSSA